ncbi:MAG: hypothetical protein J5780_00950 [Treponema sp.]|nr:hypothetical protein [Treponema sp.]
MKKILLFSFCIFLCISCSKSGRQENGILEVSQDVSVKNIEHLKFHKWYSFSDGKIQEDVKPDKAPDVQPRPWTDAVRISSAGCVPKDSRRASYEAYAVLNKRGMIAFTENSAELFGDEMLFSGTTADGLVFSAGKPVLYFYKSSFFNDDEKKKPAPVLGSRCFLAEFDSSTKNFYPLVTYENMNLTQNEQITGYFWDGKTWMCCVKDTSNDIRDLAGKFKYLLWEPPMALTEISPALGGEVFYFQYSNESVYLSLSLPKKFEEAPAELKKLLSALPKKTSFYVSWRNTDGTSPIGYFNEGTGDVSINAKGGIFERAGIMAVVFSEGTVFIKKISGEETVSLRLPRLPAGFVYGEVCAAGSSLYVSWEENDFEYFYKTKRSGFIKIDVSNIL